MLRAAVGSQEPRGGGAAAGTRGLPSLGCSAERVSFVLRFVSASAERGGGLREPRGSPEGAPLRELPRWMVSENFAA